MKAILSAVILLLLASCNNMQTQPERSTKGFSKEQLHLVELKNQYNSDYINAPNDIVKKEVRDSFLKKVHTYFVDTLRYVLPNFKITVDEITVQDISGVKAFYAKFYDDDNYQYASVSNNEYWMEFDYSPDSANKMEKNPAYQLLRTMPKNADTVLSFFYMGEVEWKDAISDQLKLQVVPFPKNYNFDSSRNANTKPIGKK